MYSILHNTDTTTTISKNNKTGEEKEIIDPAWTTNGNILAAVEKQLETTKTHLVASKIHFEAAFFDSALTEKKSYSTLRVLQKDENRKKVVTELFRGLVDQHANLPGGYFEWAKIAEPEALFSTRM